MINFENRYGNVTVSNEFFADLIGFAASSCFGVASMVPKGMQRIKNFITRKQAVNTGIIVRGNINEINVDLHITVTFGVNINAIAKSIVHKVKYTVQDATGISVNKVTVHVDGMKQT